MTDPVITVCIPTHAERGLYIDELLQSLRCSIEELGEPVEIIVVDSAASPESGTVEAASARHGARYLRGPISAGAKRNIAARAASARLLFFIDSDCLASRSTLVAHYRAISGAPETVAGIVGLTRMVGEETKVWHQIRGSQFHNPCFDFATRYTAVSWGTTANLLVRRDVFLKCGGFDESSFTSVGGEDVDLGLRISDAMYDWMTSADALVFHRRDNITQLRQIVRRLYTYGRADVFLGDRHPRFRTWHANPYAVGALVGLGMLATGRARSTVPAGVLGASAMMVWEVYRRGRSVRSAYGDLDRAVVGSLCERARWVAVDSAFDAGILVESVRRGMPWRAFTRFDYADPDRFVSA